MHRVTICYCTKLSFFGDFFTETNFPLVVRMLQQAVIPVFERNEIEKEMNFFRKKWRSCESENKILNVLSVHPYLGFKFLS